MKIKKIEIKNLNSIEEACIDFSIEPLKNEWLFLICGATGTGKSTILDAITLALFDEAARYSFIQNKEKIGEEPSNSTSHMLRRGTTEGYARVFFDVKGTEYIATWRRSKTRTGNFHKDDRRMLERIERGNSVLLSNKVKDVNNEISNLIGVSYEQFMRSVMLAQGHFNTFLTSDKSKQAEILEMLTGTKIYSDIAAAINEKKNKAFSELKSLQAHRDRENKDVITSDEIEILSRRKELLNKQIEEEGLRKSRLADKKIWLETRNRIVADVEKAEREYDERNRSRESDVFKHDEWIVKAYDDTEEIRNVLRDNHRQHKAESEINVEIENLKLNFSACCQALDVMHHDVDHKQNILASEQKRYDECRDKEILYREIGKVITLLNAAYHDKQNFEALELSLRQIFEQIQDLESDLTKKKAAACASNNDYDQKNKLYMLAEQKCHGLDISKIQEEYHAIQSHLMRKNNLSLVLNQVQDEMNVYWAKEKQIMACRDDIEKITQELDVLNATLEKKNTCYQQCVTVYDKNKAAVENWAREYRAVLHEGDPCPVCGNTSHIYNDDSAIVSLVQRLGHDMKVAEQDLNDAKDLFNKRQSELNYRKTYLEQLQNELNNCRDNVYKLCQKELLPTQEMITEKIEACRAEIDILTKQLETSKDNLDNAHKLLNDKDNSRNERDMAKSLCDKANEACMLAENALKLILEKQRLKIEGKNQMTFDIEAKIAELNEVMTDCEWRTNWEKDPVNYARQLQHDADEWQRLGQSIEKQISDIESQLKVIRLAEERKNSILSMNPDFMSCGVVHVSLEGQVDELLLMIQDNLKRKLSELSDVGRQIQETQRVISAFLVDRKDGITMEILSDLNNRNDIKELRQRVKTINDEFLAIETTLKNKRHDLMQHDSGVETPSEVETMDVLLEQLQQCETTIKGYQEECNKIELIQNTDAQLRDKIEKLQKDIDAQNVVANRWNELSMAIGSTDKNNFRNYAQSYTMAILLEKANEFLIQLSARYQLYCEKGSLAIQVTDLNMGGEHRAASSLSGGESFLVSLSLALGLASLNEQNIEMDMLFIDEGFGTLDGDSLDMVMTTLENLKGLKRKVGIISHVESLKERIPVKIMLKKKSKAISCVEIERS